MATKPLPGVAPVSSENLQFVIPADSVGEPPLVAPVLQENMQFVMPEVREPSMFEMTRDFNEFKSYYQAGAFDSDVEGVGDVTDIALEAGGAILSDVGSWLGTLPIRLMQNFTDDKYEFNRRAKAEAKATTLQTLGSLRENYEALGAGIKRGVYKMAEDEGSDLDLYSAWKYWQKTADLENQRQGLAAEVLADGIFGISGDAWTAGMTDEEKKWIREGTVKPDMQAAMGGAMIADPLNYLPIGLAFRGATGGGKAALTGAERVLLKETQDMLNLQAKMLPTSKFFLAGNTAEMTVVGARQKAALAELNTKIAANSAKLAPLAQKRTIALNAMKDSLPEGSAMRGLLDDALTDVPISAGRNITGIAAASAPVVAGKFFETLGNAGAFLKMLPQETAINVMMKLGEKAGIEITEQQASLLVKSGMVGGVGYGGYSLTDQYTDNELGKLAGAASALLGPAFLKRFGRDLSIAGRQLANTKETLPYFGALAAKGSEKLVDQIIDRDVLVPVASVARQVTGAGEGKIAQRMFLPQGKLGPASSGIATFMDRSGLGRYAETAGRAARGGAHGAAVTGAFGLAASGGMENPEAFYGSLGVGAILGTAGSTFGSIARFDSPAQHWTARYGDYKYYVDNYLGEGQKENFNKLNRDLQIAVAHKIVTNPALAVEFVSKGKTAGGGHLNRLTNAMEINVDSPRAAEALISHEFTHYLEQTGGKLAFNELLIGNPILGKPGIFVEKVTPETKSKYPDLNVGDPIMVGEEGARRYKLSEEFETARKEYKEKLKDTDEFSNLTEEQLDLIMTDELVVSEIVAEHGTDFFANDRRRYRDLHRGAIGKVMEGLLETQLASNVPFLRKALAMFGGTFRPDGRLITDNALFSKLKRYPQITELVRKYNRRTEGLSPEQMKKKTASVDGDGNVISPKDVVVDVTGAELSKHPELVDLIRAGTFLQIDKDGNVIPNLAMTSREKGKYNRSFAQSLKDAIERQEADTGLPEGHVKPEVNEKTGKVKFVGRYLDDSVLDAVEKSGNWNKEQIAMLREANNNIKNRGGNEFLISYFKAAHQGGRRYINAKVENLVEVPYGIEITQQGNVLIRTVSVDQLIKNVDQLTRQQQRELTRLYGADLNTAKTMLLNDVDAYHRNHAAGEPGRTGLDADQAIAKAKADFINSAFGSGTKAQVDANPWRAGLGKKQPRDVYRSRRIERIGKITQLSGERYVDYNLINKAFMPRRKPNQPDDTIPLPFPELPGDIPGEGFGRLINVDKSKSEIAKAKAMADEQDGFSSSGTVRAKNADGRDKLFMPAKELRKELGVEQAKEIEHQRLFMPTPKAGEDYRGFHKAPGKDYGAPLHDVTGMYPEDIYSPQGARYYGSNDRAMDAKSIAIIHRMRGNPEGEVTIFRAVPEYANDIRPGDWVSLIREYAELHGKSGNAGGDGYKILSKKVKASEVFTEANSLHEWGWSPETTSGDKLFMPAATPESVSPNTVREGDVVRLNEESLRLFMPANDKVRLEDYADRKMFALASDRLGIGRMLTGPKGKKKELTIDAQGGRGFMQIFNGGGWAFKGKQTADNFIKRVKDVAGGEDSVIVGITILSDLNHLHSAYGQLAYTNALRAAIESGTITEGMANRQIREIVKRIKQAKTKKPLPAESRKVVEAIKNFADFEKAVKAKKINFNLMAKVREKAEGKTLPLTATEAAKLELDVPSIARDIADPELVGADFGKVVALLEVPVNQTPKKTDFHYSYPYTIEGPKIGFLEEFADVGELTSDPKVRTKQGRITAQPLQTVMPEFDKLRGNRFMPAK